MLRRQYKIVRSVAATTALCLFAVSASAIPQVQVPAGSAQDFLRFRLFPALIVTLAFAIIASRLRSVTKGGAIAGSLVSIVIFAFAGPGGFAGLVAVFVLTAAATRVGDDRKRRWGMAENVKGRRASQVLSNLIVAAALSIPAALLDIRWMFACTVAALAEAAADTVSSECGQVLSSRVYLVTTFERVPVGTDGGISIPGTLAGMMSGIAVAYVCFLAQLISLYSAVLAGSAAILGMFFDSLLGATLERRGWIGNNIVNLTSTIFAAAVAALFLAF